jgi:hypothetical protein
MAMKFVMFPSGVGFFSEVVRHDEFLLQNERGYEEQPIAAGFLSLSSSEESFEALSLGGRSMDLGLGSATAYLDWKERFLSFGAQPELQEYGTYRAKAFFFAFSKIKQFDARSVGKLSTVKVSTVEDLIKELKTNRFG